MTTAASSPLVPFKREVLPNGATVLLKENRSVPLTAVDLWVATGAACENPDEGGISHFLEHLFFKGTSKRPVGVMDREIKSLGGYNNAATSYDFTHYFVVLPSQHTDLALDILIDALRNMDPPEEEIEKERQVVLEEIARRDDSPVGKLYDDFFEKIFAGTPYGKPILGTEESLRRIDRDHISDYRSRLYHPGNLHVAVAGDIDPDRTLRRVEDLLGGFASNANPPPAESVPYSNGKTVEFEFAKDIQQTYLLYGLRAPAIQGSQDEIALDVISTLLGDGRSSRLVHRLVEQSGLCSNVSAFVWTLDRVSMFGVEACYREEDEDEVRSILEEELDRIRREPLSEEEVEKAKTILRSGYAYSLERSASMAGVLGRNSACGLLEEAVAYCERVERMDGKTAQEALNRCCPAEAYTLGFVRPQKKVS